MKTGFVASSGRLFWIDDVKGISILWIALFHLIIVYNDGVYPALVGWDGFMDVMRAADWGSAWSVVSSFCGVVTAAVMQRGSQSVGVFILLSGFGLTFSMLKSGKGESGWGGWLWKRFIRLYPLYWLAHLVYLVSPFIYRGDPVDWRWFLSLLGDRFLPVEPLFYYMNPALWYFGLLIQLYAVFPLLFHIMKRVGPIPFTVGCWAFAVFTRAMLPVIHVSGYYAQGAFFGGRIADFSSGMLLAVCFFHDRKRTEAFLFSFKGLLAGIVIYGLGIWSYSPTFFFCFTDGLIATGLFMILVHVALVLRRASTSLAGIISVVGAYSYGVYLLHQPYITYCGKLFQGMRFPLMVVLGVLVVSVICLCSIPIEHGLTGFISRRFGGKPKPALAAAGEGGSPGSKSAA